MEILRPHVLFYRRYVDDCLLIAKREGLQLYLDEFNNYNENLKFTNELENNKKQTYLDLLIILIILENDKIITNWYIKPTASVRYINGFSHQQKKTVIILLVDKAIKLSDVTFQENNLPLIKEILSCNDYPLHFINANTKRRIHKHALTLHQQHFYDFIHFTETRFQSFH